jgi:uncharacterized protein YjbK
MANDLVTFKTFLSKGEYARLAKLYSDKPSNLQINYYFDTSRFTLKASEILLRVRKREDYELTLRRKKGYKKVELTEIITEEEFKNFVETGQIPSATIEAEISELIKGQTLTNYMSLSTFRIFFTYEKGTVAIDKCEYVDVIDYELEYSAPTYDLGKKNFVEFVKSLGIVYKKGDAKIKRAYNALKRTL